MIIGEDLMHGLDTKIDYGMGIIAWDGSTKPMRSVNTGRQDLYLTQEEHYHSDTLKMALNRQEEALHVTSTPV